MLDVYCSGSHHVARSIHLNLIDWGLRGCIFRVCIAPEAALLGVYRTGSRHVGCVSYRKPPCWVCIVPQWEPPCCTLHPFKFD